MLRLLIEDVTLTRGDDIRVEVRWKGGATTELHVPIPLNCFEARRTSREALDQIAALARDHTDDQIAEILNERGIRTGTGRPFTGGRVRLPPQEPWDPRLLRASPPGRAWSPGRRS